MKKAFKKVYSLFSISILFLAVSTFWNTALPSVDQKGSMISIASADDDEENKEDEDDGGNDDVDGIANVFDVHIGEDDFAYYEQENDENGNGILDSYEAVASN